MKGREIVAELTALLESNANARAWLNDSDARARKIIEALSPEQAASSQAEQPASDFVVQEKDGRDDFTPLHERREVQFDGDPVAKSLTTLVTPKQLGMIRALAREAGVDYELECQAQLNCKPDELSKRAASAFIDYLKTIREQGADFRQVG
jgi:hypothetical protein